MCTYFLLHLPHINIQYKIFLTLKSPCYAQQQTNKTKQIKADLYDWIRPLNAMDATLNYYLRIYPSLLLLPRGGGEGGGHSDNNVNDSNNNKNSNEKSSPPPQKVIQSIRTILSFLSQLLRNATNKSIFNSVSELSSFLASSDDDIVGLAIDALCALSILPMLHRQQAPEMGGHVTALHRASQRSSNNSGGGEGSGGGGDECNVMWRLMACARGWGTKGSGLGLLDCVTLDDDNSSMSLLLLNDHDKKKATTATGEGGEGEVDDGEEKQQLHHTKEEESFYKCAGEISFECYVPPKVVLVDDDDGEEEEDGVSSKEKKKKKEKKSGGHLVTLYIPKEEMFIQPGESSALATTTTRDRSSSAATASSSNSDDSATKRRKIAIVPRRAI